MDRGAKDPEKWLLHDEIFEGLFVPQPFSLLPSLEPDG
jgi:hypothetical protein